MELDTALDGAWRGLGHGAHGRNEAAWGVVRISSAAGALLERETREGGPRQASKAGRCVAARQPPAPKGALRRVRQLRRARDSRGRLGFSATVLQYVGLLWLRQVMLC